MARIKAGWQADDVLGIPKLVNRLEAKRESDAGMEEIEVM